MNAVTWLRSHGAAVVLASLMLASLPIGLSAAQWLRSDEVLAEAALCGAGLGLLMAYCVRRPAVTGGVAIIGGALFITLSQGRALPPFEPAGRELVSAGQWATFAALRAVLGIIRPDMILPAVAPPTLPEWQAAWERLLLYNWNLQADWPPVLAPRHWQSGQIVLAAILGWLVWVVTALGVWELARQGRVWGALLPVLGLLAISSYFTARGWGYLTLCLSCGLLLAGNTLHRRLAERWGEGALPYALAGDRWAASLAITVVVGLVMLATIELTSPEFHRWWDETFSSHKTATGSGGSSRPGGGGVEAGLWPRQHLLGSGPDLSTYTVMFVSTPGVAPAHFYWRATSYDEYTGHGWIQHITDNLVADAAPLWPEPPDPPPYSALLRQGFRLEGHTSQIYAAGRPVRLSVSARGYWLDPQGDDLVLVEAITPLSAYEVLSWVSVATPDELRGASEDYPDWVGSYLELPEELPERVVRLARQITAEAPTAYDQAQVIADYLRTYEYTLDLSAPPANRDAVDNFLFDLKRGYCDYYASAMVVMARSVGLPARLAVGYATGDYDPEPGMYQVSMADAHSWAEIYFPAFGWIPFEPTAGRPALEYGPTGEWVAQAESARQQNIQAFEGQTTSGAGGEGFAWPLIGGLAATMAAGGVVLALAIRQRKRRRGTPEQVIISLYRELLRNSRRLGVPLSETQTPREFLSALLAELALRARNAPRRTGDWDRRLSQVSQAAGRLVALYGDVCYSPRRPARAAAEEALDAWPALSRALWLFRLAGLSGQSGRNRPAEVGNIGQYS